MSNNQNQISPKFEFTDSHNVFFFRFSKANDRRQSSRIRLYVENDCSTSTSHDVTGANMKASIPVGFKDLIHRWIHLKTYLNLLRNSFRLGIDSRLSQNDKKFQIASPSRTVFVSSFVIVAEMYEKGV